MFQSPPTEAETSVMLTLTSLTCAWVRRTKNKQHPHITSLEPHLMMYTPNIFLLLNLLLLLFRQLCQFFWPVPAQQIQMSPKGKHAYHLLANAQIITQLYVWSITNLHAQNGYPQEKRGGERKRKGGRNRWRKREDGDGYPTCNK